MPIVKEYVRQDGTNPYQLWFNSLNSIAAAKIATARARIEAGNKSQLKSVGGGMTEYTLDWGPGYRIYLANDGNEVILLFGGGTKAQQPADIAKAKSLLQEYKAFKAKSKKNAVSSKPAKATKKKKKGKS